MAEFGIGPFRGEVVYRNFGPVSGCKVQLISASTHLAE